MKNGCRPIPVQFRNFPVRFKKFPVLLLGTLTASDLQFRVDWVPNLQNYAPRLRNSLLISLLAGNFDAETGSIGTASSANVSQLGL
jgi:hypothetical protein